MVKRKEAVLIFFIIIFSAFLRLWKLDKVPVSLFSDELDVGYQVYSIIKTGKDYMGNSWPLYFHSYADLRAPIYIYSSIPSVHFFGISPYGVRLPAALFGILGVWAVYLLGNELVKERFGKWNLKFGILPAFLLAISPWHIQYSRAAFEVTEMLFFLLMGLYFFFKSFKKGNNIIWSVIFLGMTPWIYSTAKFFIPLLILFLFVTWRKEIIKIGKVKLLVAVVGLGIFFIPLAFSIINGSGAQRFSYISVFTDPTVEGEVATQRLVDAKMGGGDRGVVDKVLSRIVHNKLVFWFNAVINNYYETFSTQFLFLEGDINLRHSPQGVGQLYKIEALLLVVGAVCFFTTFKNRKIVKLFIFWVIAGVLPSAITRDGGNHASRLILILPPLVFFVSYGLYFLITKLGGIRKKLAIYFCGFVYLVSLFFYLHNYYVHNPWYSEREWHAGYKEMVESVKMVEGDFERIILSNAQDSPQIFLAAYYPYDPTTWQKGFDEEELNGLGKLPHIGKYYFGQVGEEGVESLPQILDDNTLYVAAQREIGKNLIMDPQFTPKGVELVKSITYPSGEPAFYLFRLKDSI